MLTETEKNAYRILKFIYEKSKIRHELKEPITGEMISKAIGLTPNQINDAIILLREDGWIDCMIDRNIMGPNAPYVFGLLTFRLVKESELRDIFQISSEVYSASEAAQGLLLDIKSGYKDLYATFNVNQIDLNNQIQLPEKLDSIVENINSIREKSEIIEQLKIITEQTRPPTFWQRVKASIIDNIIGYILALIIGFILAAFGLSFLY